MKFRAVLIFQVLLILVSLVSCSNNDEDNGQSINDNSGNNIIQDQILTMDDQVALLFMIEEEKLARDTYSFLYENWGINQFSNIMNSEQSHMNAIANLLDAYNIDYNILEQGVFSNTELQDYYDQFIIEGSLSSNNALQIGATIEDLDIVDLQEYIDTTNNTALIAVFENLQCGSRNHLRSFVSSIENIGSYYVPQFLDQYQYDDILNGQHEQCN